MRAVTRPWDCFVSADIDDVLNVVEAAALLRVHPVTLRKRAVAWGVPHRRLGSEWRFSKRMLLEWLRGQSN
jgi:excisionase family DNA binding protein